MSIQESQRVGDSFFINIEDVHEGCLDTRVAPCQHAVYLHFLLPVGSCHRVGAQVSIIPFSLRGFQGQTFHYSEGAFVPCCDEVRESDILSPISDLAEEIYKTAVPWHKWNLRAPGFWSELSQSSAQPPLQCIETSRYNMDLLVTQARLFKPATPVNNLLDDTSSDMPEMSSSSSHTRASSRDSPSLRSYPNTPRPSKRKRKEESATSVEAVTATADAFLYRLGSTSIPEEEISSYNALTKIKSQPLSPRGENVSRAWEMCISFARRSNQKLKYGRFLRFLSLCFFLIWERHSDKQGKSAAREVNAKMREAGFSGHSRGLKTMRDETTLINRMVASIQEACGPKQAATLYHVIFEPSNYQLIRTINRLGSEKKSSILAHMCRNARLESFPSYSSSTTCVQSIIQQYLPNLSTDAINKAIGYQPLSETCHNLTERRIRAPKPLSSLQLPDFEIERVSESRKPRLTNYQNMFGDLDRTMSGDGAADIPAGLDTLHGDDSPFLQLPTVIDDLEFEFPFSMDVDSMDGGLGVLTEAGHPELLAL
ncbi:unnamed protein product [Penicillium olsonii]|nr:unnamed protein product [Penicillium olsonii]